MQPDFTTLKPIENSSQPDFNTLKPVSAATPNSSPGFVQSTIQGIASPFLKLAATVRGIKDETKSIVGQVTGNQVMNKSGADELNKGQTEGYDMGYLGKVKPMSSFKEAAGVGLEAGSMVATGGTGELGVAGRIGLNTATGAAMGAGSSLSNGQNAKQTLTNTIIGGIAGGATSALTEGVTALVQKLPNWLARMALPKLKPENIDYAIHNTPVGNTATMLEHSDSSVANLSDQIRTALSHPDYSSSEFLVNEANKPEVFEQLASSFQNSEYTPETVLKTVKDYVPGQAKLVQKIADGTATLAEQNEVRSAIDVANKSVYNSISRPPENKAIAQGLADILRRNIQETAPETAPIFKNLSQELDLNKVLTSIDKKNQLKPTLYDIVAGIEGFREGGITGAGKAIIGERLVRSKAGQMVAAKTASVLSKTAPVISKIGQAAQIPAVIKATSQ